MLLKKNIGEKYILEKLLLRDDGSEYSLVEYKNSTNFVLKHICGHTFKTSNSHFFIRGDICKKCSSIKRGISSRKKQDEFVKQVPEILNGEIIMLSDYITSDKKIHFKHLKCGREFWRSPDNILNKKIACPLCAVENKRTNLKSIEKFKKQLYDMYGNEYELVNGYYGAHKKSAFKHITCGNIVEITPNNLLRGYGCKFCASSKGEKAIRKYLTEKNIVFTEQKTYDDCISSKGVKLKFDFFLDDKNILIEYDGSQHYSMDNFYDKTEEDLKIQQENDSIKNEYALKNNIKIIRIPYWDFDKINEILNRSI